MLSNFRKLNYYNGIRLSSVCECMANSDFYSPGLETYQNHLGYTLGYQLHLPKKPSPDGKPPPVLVYFPGFGGSMTSKSIIHTMDDVLEADVAVVRFDTTPVKRGSNFEALKVDTSMLTPSYYVKTVHEALKHTVNTYGPQGQNLIDTGNLGVAASSFGARNGLYYAAHMNGLEKRVLKEPCVPIKGMVLQAPFLTLRPFRWAIWLDKTLYKNKWKRDGFVNVPIAGDMMDVAYGVYTELTEVDTFKDIAPHVTCPVKIIYGTQDNLSGTVNVDLLEKSLTQVEPQYKQKHKIENVGHFFEDKKKIAALKKIKEEELRQLVKFASEEDTKNTLIARYIEENVRSLTCLNTVVNLSRDFLKEKVFVVGNDNGFDHNRLGADDLPKVA